MQEMKLFTSLPATDKQYSRVIRSSSIRRIAQITRLKWRLNGDRVAIENMTDFFHDRRLRLSSVTAACDTAADHDVDV